MHFELKILPLVTQNQQSTTYLCQNWNSELTLYGTHIISKRSVGTWLNLGCLTITDTTLSDLGLTGHKDTLGLAPIPPSIDPLITEPHMFLYSETNVNVSNPFKFVEIESK